MTLDWILSPVTQYGVLAFGLMSCLGLCLSTSIRMRALSTALDQERRATGACEGLNLTKRAQALRMHRRGEPLAAISAALQSPRNEIELLLKLHG
jgi:hypothetical protein